MTEDTKKIEKIDLNKLIAKDGVLLIQHQDLPTPHLARLDEIQAVTLNGTIKAAANFYEKRTKEIENNKSHVIYSYRERRVTLITKEDYENLGSEIIGKLTENPDLNTFGINTNKTFSVGELVKHIRTNRFFFENKDVHAKVVNSLQNFSAKVNADIKKINDNRGNIEDVLKVTMDSNAELNFNALMPVFIGEEAKSFNVEIACQADNSKVIFWLESPDLFELLKKDTKTIIDSELARFNSELVFIEQ